MLRRDAHDAIRRWHYEFGLSQKSLASIVGVSDCTISRCVNEPEWPIGDDTLRKIIEAVETEAANRVLPLKLTVVAYCHDQTFARSEAANKAAILSIKHSLMNGSCECKLPDGCRGVLVQVGESQSRMFLIVLTHATTAEEKRALAHELEHIRDLILKGIAVESTPPRSSF